MIPSVRGGDGSVYSPPPSPFPFHFLEVTLISAQDLHPAVWVMSTYAVAYVRPGNRVRSRDAAGHPAPAWNDKVVFRIDDDLLRSETSAITVDVYAARPSFLPGADPLLGTARVLISSLRPSCEVRCVALQVRRPSSLRPQGILNLGVALLDAYDDRLPLYADLGFCPTGASATSRPEGERSTRAQATDAERAELDRKLKRWRSELQPMSGEVVRGEKGGDCAGPVATVAEERAVDRRRRGRSFGGLYCFSGGFTDETTPAIAIK